ncbi:hypothetical protein [Anabaena azotica]|uniref:PFE-CTERM domain-containing protein n=1 Tax=Anabaena azotica TaxID=197653 RepID=UPI0039A698B6
MRQFIKFALGGIAFLSCFQTALSAQALTYQFTWTGDNGYSAVGNFSFNDTDNDTVARTNNSNNLNEFTVFNITFRDLVSNSLATLTTYDLNQLQSFNPAFNFNYDIVNNVVLQTGNPSDSDGFSIGDGDAGFLLTSNGNDGVSFGDANETVFDFGGIVTATPIPFEFSPTLSLGILGAVFAIQKGRKRLQIKTTSIPKLEQEQD